MSNEYLINALAPATQREQLPGQVPNSAGGFSFAVDDWTRLDRFLILGSEGGSYYATERKLTRDNAQCVERCIRADGPRTVRRIVEISDAGRAPKNDPAILALAMCARMGDAITRAEAFRAVQKVCRIGTHLYHFVAFADQLGGWGRGLRRAVASWFNDKKVDDLAHQLIKYQQRDGWSARDLLRLAHVRPVDEAHASIYKYVTRGIDEVLTDGDMIPTSIAAAEEIKTCENRERVLHLITTYKLPREAIPTKWLTEAVVWDALLPHMGVTAIIRNLATMTRVGLVAPMSAACGVVREKITDVGILRRGRVHPIAVLSALRTYQQGRGERGSSTWTPVQQVVDALDSAFYASFGAVESTGKRVLLALDVSGSMNSGTVAGVPGLTPREASVAMAMVTAAVEPNHHMMGFSSRFIPLQISPRRSLADNIATVSRLPFERTDCSLPMMWAQQQKVDVDGFVVYTDSETYAGRIHPTEALRQYRMSRGIAAREAVVGMLANPFTIADPNDAGQLDVVGFDTATPQILSQFIRGE